MIRYRQLTCAGVVLGSLALGIATATVSAQIETQTPAPAPAPAPATAEPAGANPATPEPLPADPAADAAGGDKSTKDGVYTEVQSERGAAAAKTSCAACHGRTMKGGMLGPSVVGDTFKGNYEGRPLGELFDKIKMTMPQNNPGTLTPEATADLVAFILKLNEFPTGEAEVPTDADALNKITFKQ
jgi:mono/diheme cytochrome c family protein